IFPRRSCAEIFRLSPYCPARAMRTAVFRTKHQPAIRGQIKAFGQTGSPLLFFSHLPVSVKPPHSDAVFSGRKSLPGPAGLVAIELKFSIGQYAPAARVYMRKARLRVIGHQFGVFGI